MDVCVARRRRLLRLQSLVQRMERRLGARLLAHAALDLQCRRRRQAIVAALACSRQALFARAQLSAFDCFALATFTGYSAEQAGVWRQRQADAAKSITLLAPQRQRWARLGKGIERRMPATVGPSASGDV